VAMSKINEHEHSLINIKIYSTEKFVLLGVKSHTRSLLEKFLGPESYRFSV
jgi:hypothetical protein